MTPDEYARRFVVRPTPYLSDDRCLVQLGIPASDQVVVWYARPPGAPALGDAAIEVRGDGRPLAAVHEPVGSVGRIRATGLEPDTWYRLEIRLGSDSCTRWAKTAPARSSAAPFSFLASSCFAPFTGAPDAAIKRRTVHSLALLRERALAAHRGREGGAGGPSFLLGMGDQVYVDDGAYLGPLSRPGPRALLVGKHSDRRAYAGRPDEFFALLYRRHLGLPPLDEALAALPSAMMWDDHDIRDGWGSQKDEDERNGDGTYVWQEHLDCARRHFVAHQMLRNPAPIVPDGGNWSALIGHGSAPTQRPEFHFAFDWGAATTFFVMDLRSRRCASSRRAMSAEQQGALSSWLERERPRPTLFVLVSALPLTQRAGHPWNVEWILRTRRDDRRDSWWSGENRVQRDEVLSTLVEHFLRKKRDRLLVLSGDVHFAEVLTLVLTEADGSRRAFGHEIIASGLAVSKFYSGFLYPSRRNPQRTVRFLGDRLRSIGRGARLFAPHFVELFVDPRDPDAAPELDVRFYPAADREGKRGRLVNPLSAEPAAPIPLSLSDPDPAPDRAFFEKFMRRGQGAPCWDEDAVDWTGYL